MLLLERSERLMIPGFQEVFSQAYDYCKLKTNDLKGAGPPRFSGSKKEPTLVSLSPSWAGSMDGACRYKSYKE